ncbi:hypothetical protein FKW77_006554 [Venturia effusa]|uniref:Cytochrome P450 n=1 Tax=Venturia effusa TaxID=50376 RepID=A0A517KZM2_9PEZI|nr:hypothetical protein FKW77_006554 [Venturia effusa]
MAAIIIYVLLTLIAVCYLSDWLSSLFDGPEAPPRVHARVPLIGHALGLYFKGASYYTDLSARQSSEIYTINILHLKIYVVNSRHLIPLVQRHSKTLSFTPFQKVVARDVSGCGTLTVGLHDDELFMRDFMRATREALAPGVHLDYQNRRAVVSLEEMLGGMGGEGGRLRLYEWVKHVITVASSDGVYGRRNPFRDEGVEKAFWTWHDGTPAMATGFSIFVPAAVRARQFLVDAIKKYHRGDFSDAAQVTKERIRVLREYGVSEDDVARMQLSFNIALLPNSVPTTFWVIFNTFSHPNLFLRLREELERKAVKRSDGKRYGLDVSALKTKCPLLLSIFEETQRHQTVHANIRVVEEDTRLNSWHLQKGNFLQIPNQPIHFNKDLWGDDYEVFNPNRFQARKDGASSNSFLAWGAAPHLCPARQFASTEILVMLALLVLRVDLVPVGGIWGRPDPKYGEATTILAPGGDVEVGVALRDEWVGEWVIEMGDSRAKVPLASG